MELDNSLDTIAQVLSGQPPIPTFREFVDALATLIASNWQVPEGIAAQEWQAKRHEQILARLPGGSLKCSNDGGGGERQVGTTNDAWRREVVSEAVNLALAEFDARTLRNLRSRFQLEAFNALSIFELAAVDQVFWEVSHGSARAATTTAQLLGETGCPELLESFAIRLYISDNVRRLKPSWERIYQRDLGEMDFLVDRCNEVMKPRELNPAEIKWDPVQIYGGSHAGENTVETHIAYVVLQGERLRIYTGQTDRGDFDGRGARPDHQLEASAKLEELNRERQTDFDANLGRSLKRLKKSIVGALSQD